jgi:sugar (pentulose or hexulose) kinase
MDKIFLGIDIGTHSVRVGAFNQRGGLRGKGEHPIRIRRAWWMTGISAWHRICQITLPSDTATS